MKRRLNFNSLVCKYLFNLGRLGEVSTKGGQLTACLQATNFVKAGSTQNYQLPLVNASYIHNAYHPFLCKSRGGVVYM